MVNRSAMYACYKWLRVIPPHVHIHSIEIGPTNWEFLLSSEPTPVDGVLYTGSKNLRIAWIDNGYSNSESDELAAKFVEANSNLIIQIGFKPYRQYMNLFDYFIDHDDCLRIYESGNFDQFADHVYVHGGVALTNDEDVYLHMKMICQQQ